MISARTKSACSVLIEEKHLPESFAEIVSDIYLPLSKIIMDKKQQGPLLISINGMQGTGKSTMTGFLKTIIESEINAEVAELSLDDFYLTRAQRRALADTVHPLLSTRGVPGTHDVELLAEVLDALSAQQACVIPRFDKAMDERCDKNRWTVIDKPVDVILFEGWCNNSPAQRDDELEHPVNALEETEDEAGIWRQFVNEKLIEYQQRIFNRADMCIMLKAPDFECIYEWRNLQEAKLRAKVASSGHAGAASFVMDEAELKRFIQHYERISRHTLEHLPDIADVVLPVAADHMITDIVLGQS